MAGRGEPETGRPFGQESVELARRLGDDVQLAESLLWSLLTIDPAWSGQLYTEAIACAERSGDYLTKCNLHNNAGAAALGTGDIPAARAHLEAAAQTAQQIGWENVFVTVNTGTMLRAEGNLDGAQSAVEARSSGAAGSQSDSPWPRCRPEPSQRLSRAPQVDEVHARRAAARRPGRR
jgi:hypothetical protein